MHETMTEQESMNERHKKEQKKKNKGLQTSTENDKMPLTMYQRNKRMDK